MRISGRVISNQHQFFMKQVWLSLFLVATFVISCSSSDTTENNTEQSTVNTNQAPSNTEGNQPVAVAASFEETAPTSPEVDNSEDVSTVEAGEMESTTENKTNKVVPKNESVKTNIKPVPAEIVSNSASDENEVVEAKPATPVTTPAKATTTTKPAATTTVASKPAAKPAKAVLSHDIFDALLRKHVNSSGNVNYGAFKKDKAKLVEYIDVLKSNPPQSSWSKNKEMAYWINLYNAFTIHSIVEKYPVSSVMDLEGGKVWDKKKIVIAGKSLTLNNIEKDKLLKRFKEPRVHFAVNCAAASCPPLLNKAWTEDNVQRYYAKQAKAFINNSSYNSVSSKSIEASQIFNWYASDFGGSEQIIPYFQKYSETEIKKSAKVSFKKYDWTLNKQ
jgi:hypothetical protein